MLCAWAVSAKVRQLGGEVTFEPGVIADYPHRSVVEESINLGLACFTFFARLDPIDEAAHASLLPATSPLQLLVATEFVLALMACHIRPPRRSY